MPLPTFESYDLARPTRSNAASIHQHDDLFHTLFPQPPPRSRAQAERLARPSLPSLKASAHAHAHAHAQAESADSSRSTAQLFTSSNSIESLNSLSSYPSSSSSLSLLQTILPDKHTSADSSIDHYSPAVSDVNSAETDHSISSSHAHSHSSEIDANDPHDPLTPITPSGNPNTWRPRELNLVRKRQAPAQPEPSIPVYNSTPSWNPPPISADRNALLVGLGLGGVVLNPHPPATAPALVNNLPADKLAQSHQGRAYLRSKSPQLVSTATMPRDTLPQGPKQLLLVSSGGPPAVRRFGGRRPSESLLEAFTSPQPTPASEQSSRCTTPQMRSPLPVMPSGPAFDPSTLQSPDPSSLAPPQRQTPLSAEEFIAQIASTPQYQASSFLEPTASASTTPTPRDPLHQLQPSAYAESSYQPPPLSARSDMAVDHSDQYDTAAPGPSSAPAGPSTTTSFLPTRAPGFSSGQRSRAASLSRRKAAPTPLVLTSSPTTSNSDTLPGSADARRRRSPAAAANQRSPLSASHPRSPGKPPAWHESAPAPDAPKTASDYSEPLRTAFYDFDSEEESDQDQSAAKASSQSHGNAIAHIEHSEPAAETATCNTASAQATIFDRIMRQSPPSRLSAPSSVADSLDLAGQTRHSSGSDSAAAFEYEDLETSSSTEGLSLQTMLGFLHHPPTRKSSLASAAGAGTAMTVSDSLSSLESQVEPAARAPSHTRTTPPASAAPSVPKFNIAIFAPNQPAEQAPFADTVDPRQPVEAGSAVRSRKQSIVPAPPSFAIRDNTRDDPAAPSPPLVPSVSDGPEVHPALVMAHTSEAPVGESRWSSGSESDGESAVSTKGARKSFSKGRKSFSNSRKNSIAIARDLIAGPVAAKEPAPEAGRRQSKRSSKSRLSQGAAVQAAPVPSKPSAGSVSKRLLLNGLPSLRKKSMSNLSGQSASPSTPGTARDLASPASAFADRTEFPFPLPPSPQVVSLPPVPGLTTRPFQGPESTTLPAQNGSSPGPSFSPQFVAEPPVTPTLAQHSSLSDASTAPLTTQQILAQARSNIWPENYIGTSVSAAGLSSPYLSTTHDAFSYDFRPSRLAPTPPQSAPAWATREPSSSASSPVTPVMPATIDKKLPSTPVDPSWPMGRSRSRPSPSEDAPLPPRNLRHLRQSSSNTTLDKARVDVPADVFRPSHSSEASVMEPQLSHTRSDSELSTPHHASFDADEERLPTIAETSMATEVGRAELSIAGADVVEFDGPARRLISRQQAKLQKARRIRRQKDRFPRYNSMSDLGLQWMSERGSDAYDMLAAEGLPSSAVLAATTGSSGTTPRVLASGGGGGDDAGGSSDDSDTDDYGSSDGGGGGRGFGGGSGGGGGKRPGSGRNPGDDDQDDSEDDDESSDEEEEAEALTEGDSEDDYGAVEQSAATRGAGMPVVPTRNASMPAVQVDAEEADSDSSDDKPLGTLVDDPKALQKALRAQERRRHFALAQQALEGKSANSSATPSTHGHARHAPPAQARGQTSDAVVNPNDLAQKLAQVQARRDIAHPPNAAIMQRAQTVARHDAGRGADRQQVADVASVARSKSVRTTPRERNVHPGLKARTPSEAALRARAAVQAMPLTSSAISPTIPAMSKMPDLPSNAMATVVAAQKAMALAQANPSPAALAQAQALASSATAALNAATAQVKRGTSSPISPAFNQGEPVGHTPTSPRLPEVAEMANPRQRVDLRSHAAPPVSAGGLGIVPAAAAPGHHPSMLQRLRSRSVSRNQAALTINTAAAPPMPELARPGTGSKDSQASGSPHSAQAATFAALSQAAMQHGRPPAEAVTGSVDSHAAQMQRGASSMPSNVATSHDNVVAPPLATAEMRQPHKVYILSRQRFAVVEVPVSARARDLALEVIERERLPMDDSKGGWVVFDCSAQLGIERPLREYEMITDVVNVRAHPQTDFFLIKRTELSPYLSIRAVPASSPALAGYVYVQDRKKKWNKRWLELRDHALYHAKNERGKDETSICQISTFDVYLVDGSAVKMPKANGFALRSQDPITMFEKPDQDYIHYFCLTDPAAHRDWVRAILNARTYILRQEKAVLFHVDSPGVGQEAGFAGAMASGGLSRKNTARRPNGRGAGEAAPPSGVATAPSPLIDSSAFAGPFAKGSLLADKAINDAKEALRGHPATAPPTAAMHDLGLMDRNALRQNEARRREDAIERQRRMKADGQPLIDLVRK